MELDVEAGGSKLIGRGCGGGGCRRSVGIRKGRSAFATLPKQVREQIRSGRHRSRIARSEIGARAPIKKSTPHVSCITMLPTAPLHTSSIVAIRVIARQALFETGI